MRLWFWSITNKITHPLKYLSSPIIITLFCLPRFKYKYNNYTFKISFVMYEKNIFLHKIFKTPISLLYNLMLT